MANRERSTQDWPFAINPFAEMMRRQAELALSAQEDALRDLSVAVDGWIGRRQAATESAVAALRQIAQSQDAGEASQVMSEWAQGSFERLSEDARDQLELGLRLANRLAAAEAAGVASAPLPEAANTQEPAPATPSSTATKNGGAEPKRAAG